KRDPLGLMQHLVGPLQRRTRRHLYDAYEIALVLRRNETRRRLPETPACQQDEDDIGDPDNPERPDRARRQPSIACRKPPEACVEAPGECTQDGTPSAARNGFFRARLEDQGR